MQSEFWCPSPEGPAWERIAPIDWRPNFSPTTQILVLTLNEDRADRAVTLASELAQRTGGG